MKLALEDEERQKFISTLEQAIDFYDSRLLLKEEQPYFDQLQIFLEFLNDRERAVELFVAMHGKLMCIRDELERECKGLLFLCLSNFSSQLTSAKLMDLVFEEWKASSAAQRNENYRLIRTLFFETVRVLSVRQMGVEVYTLFKGFTSFMLLRQLTIPYFNYPLAFFINSITVENALSLAKQVITK